MDILGALGGTAWAAAFFIIALSIIVAIHEYGHYIVGRWSGIHAEVFSLGFGPVLFSRTDRRGTKWQVAAIPFGGYVKFLGDADASSVRRAANSGLSPEERRHTMAGAPLWARAATVAAGPIANFLLTFVVLGGLLLVTGVARDAPTIGSLKPIPAEQTLREGDLILAVEGRPTPDTKAFGQVLGDLPRTPTVAVTLQRDGQEMTVQAPNPMLPLIASVAVKSAAIDAGLKAGDVILRAGGRDMVTFTDIQDVVFNSDGKPVPLTVWRAGETFDLTLTPRRRDIPLADGTGFETKWMMGLASGLPFEMDTRPPGAVEWVSLTARQMWDMTATTFQGLGHMIAGKISTCNMSGVIGMAETMGDAAKAGWQSFVSMLAVLSLGVGILNLLPIPVLDGGHLVFYAYEAVTRRPPSDRALRWLMAVGLTLLISLMVFALWNDVTCV
ncbi:RIP metalloprotease RseP [Pseudogemmobacter blasticus]|uniref:Zinc metalloprotease n=1 Tax=Fuscovulum blasticum DSM 2131 TaxID=1188250 RepID=A0A2T4J7H6_FUSBL|nr:RIP metalloprotease RseP [Fuscovulum blasticum]PTE13852.1 RIP metalloprotease RseP [Fuscovulum blasticum DSM 2131]